MSHYVYLISDYSHKHIHAGYCDDVVKMIEFYQFFSDTSLHYPIDKYLNRLVYCEKVWTEGQAIDRVTYFTFMPLKVRIEQILAANPDWDDLSNDEGLLSFLTN